MAVTVFLVGSGSLRMKSVMVGALEWFYTPSFCRVAN
jgi:hypothetical protein